MDNMTNEKPQMQQQVNIMTFAGYNLTKKQFKQLTMIKNAMSSSFGGYNFLLTFVISLPVFLLDFFVILIGPIWIGPIWLAIAFLPAFNSVNLLWMINKLYKAMQNGVVVTNEFSIEQVQELKKKYLITGIIGILLFAYFIFIVIMSFYLISLIV